jgi:hypothetical protein
MDTGLQESCDSVDNYCPNGRVSLPKQQESEMVRTMHMQSVLVDNLQRARLSRFHTIRLHAPPPLPPVSKLDRRHTGRLRKRENLLTRGGGGGRGDEPYARRKAWDSINQSIVRAYV